MRKSNHALAISFRSLNNYHAKSAECSILQLMVKNLLMNTSSERVCRVQFEPRGGKRYALGNVTSWVYIDFLNIEPRNCNAIEGGAAR